MSYFFLITLQNFGIFFKSNNREVSTFTSLKFAFVSNTTESAERSWYRIGLENCFDSRLCEYFFTEK